MICYRDRTYCPFYLLCKVPCERALTPEVRAAAQSACLPIAQFTDFPECFVRWFE